MSIPDKCLANVEDHFIQSGHDCIFNRMSFFYHCNAHVVFVHFGDDDDFFIFDQSILLETAGTVTAALTAFLGAIAGISLVVGGIGIMNIMLVSVTERTREIGVRKAIGALKRDILAQFLLESLVLSLLGGIIGILLGWGVSALAGNLLEVNTVIDPATVALSAGFAAAVGLIFGIYPAWRAASAGSRRWRRSWPRPGRPAPGRADAPG